MRHRIARAWALGLALLMPSCLTAQINPSLSEAERGMKTEGAGEPAQRLRIDEMNVTVHVVGRTADISMELLIASDSPDPYAAELALMLPADAVITGYSLNVGAAMIPGQLIEQPKARNIFDDEVRSDIDPGLVEVSAGNRFTTRIYPVTQGNARRVRVQFAAPFDPRTGIMLPLGRDAAIGITSISIKAEGYAEPPKVSFGGRHMALTHVGSTWTGRLDFANAALRDGLSISGGSLAAPLIRVGGREGQTFFILADGVAASKAAPRGRLRIYWDRSVSHGRGKPDLETEVLARLIDATSPTAVDLVTFASDAPAVISLSNVAELRRSLSAITYRGATSLDGLQTLSLQEASQCVFVSDGLVTIDHAAKFAPDCSLSVLTSSAEIDGTRLGRLAQSSGGRVVRVDNADIAEAVTSLAVRPVTPVSALNSIEPRLSVAAVPIARLNKVRAVVGSFTCRSRAASPVTMLPSSASATAEGVR